VIKKSLVRWSVSASAALAASVIAVAHEGDLKLRDWMGPVKGEAFRADDPASTKAAVSFRASGVRLMSWLPLNTLDAAATSGNDVWGYVSPSGKEYAIMGLSSGTAFVNVTNPSNAQLVAFRSGPNSLWRNMKTYKTYAYAVSEGGGGIQVFDLSQIDSGVVTPLASVDATTGTTATHTMIISNYVDQGGVERAFLYRMGGGSNGLRIYSLANPAVPALVGTWSPKYVHDGAVYYYSSGPYAGKEVFFACGGLNGGQTDTGMDILDVTNKSAITTLGRCTYANANFCHQVWLSEDRQFAYINDELDEDNRGIYAVGRIVNVSNLAAPVVVGTYNTGQTSIDHNEYVRGNLLYCSNYTTGLRIFDITSGASPQQVAWFDTHPDDDATPSGRPTFNGLWSNYPFLPSGTILGSDIERGLFVWRVGPEPATLTFPEGQPLWFGVRQRVAVQVALGSGSSLGTGGVSLRTTIGGTQVTTPMHEESPGLWVASAPPVPCGAPVAWSVGVSVNDGSEVRSPLQGDYAANGGSGVTQVVRDTCESASGWVIGATGDNATAGIWVNADPVGTAAQPENDVSSDGTRCFVTGNGAVGGALGVADVDGGTTSLTSPAYSIAGLNDPRIGYWRWYSNDQGTAPNADSMPVQISGDNGVTWTQLELVTENAGVWVQKDFRIRDFLLPSATTVRLRFQARDLGTGSIVEAGVDEITVSDTRCASGDLDGNGIVDAGDIGSLLLQFGGSGTGDLDGNGVVDAGDIGSLLLLF
jgi:choice-of-anchor B domain-containing protein